MSLKEQSFGWWKEAPLLASLQISVVLGAAVTLIYFAEKKQFIAHFELVIAFALALFAMLWSAYDAKRQRTKTGEIVRSMSTRYIGTFPKHVDEIADVVSHVNGTLRFLADCVDYSSFSYPEGHE